MRQKQFNRFIDRKISQKEKKIIGFIITDPVLIEINGKKTFACDIILRSNGKKIEKVPIASNNREVLNSARTNVPVELHRTQTGFLTITGRSFTKIADNSKKSYKISSLGLGGAGLSGLLGVIPEDDTGENFKTIISDVTFDPGDDVEQDTTFEVEIVPFGELNFGVDAFGKTRLIQTTTES